MRNRFDRQLLRLNQEMIDMGSLCEEMITAAAKIVATRDKELMDDIVTMEEEINQKERDIERICMKLLMQQQPVASDLRVISAAMKMVSDMERIGDHAADISEMTILMSKTKYIPNLEHINRMASETVQMLIRSIEAYVEKDMKKAVDVIASDDVVDDLFDKNKAELIEQIQRDPQSAESAADMLMVAKYFERIGDHATNIAEWVIFALDDKKMTK